MKICGIQKVSLVDYNEHIATTLFTTGCNFACPFCHNGELVRNLEPEIPEEEIFDFLTKRKNVIDAVCISGGEPTLNHDLDKFIKKIKDLGFLVKLDTNGSNIEMVKNLVENKLIDYIAMDIKNCDEKYPMTIGKNKVDFSPQESIKYIMKCGIDYEFRTTLIKEFHTLDDIEKILKTIKGAKRYYLQKFKDNENCLTSGLHEVDYNTANSMLELAKKYVEFSDLRGY